MLLKETCGKVACLEMELQHKKEELKQSKEFVITVKSSYLDVSIS